MIEKLQEKVFPDTEEKRDPVLGTLLQEWQAPQTPGTLDQRILAGYRNATRARSLWHRFLFTSVRVPVPVAALAIVLLFLAAAVAFRRPPVVTTSPPAIVGRDGLQASHTEPPVVIHTSLEGFQPVSDANVTVMEGFPK
jgi:hypothetical protein